ncbi:hypothetical protein [Mucilaginibacter segetis]|uniref:Uncharacterized protein n=1 Tax=Mucilaginibacter segetis TaxID=2793071 RepID=A0A934UMW1_9SPHI|nr:hypothetical protein [Mucilaginibacter segetis]MBK0380123.1 hypothetical protein [Mucilaginibacter segetis]
MKKSLINYVFPFFLLLAISGCRNQEKFTTEGWNDGDGISWPKRYTMVEDLLQNHKLKGMSYKQVINLLDYPQRNSHTDRSFSYEITRKMDLADTLYFKSLIFYLNKDSVVTGVKVYEFKHEKKIKKK